MRCFPRVFSFVDSEVLSLSRSPWRRFDKGLFWARYGQPFLLAEKV